MIVENTFTPAKAASIETKSTLIWVCRIIAWVFGSPKKTYAQLATIPTMIPVTIRAQSFKQVRVFGDSLFNRTDSVSFIAYLRN